VSEACNARVTTGRLNRLLAEAVQAQPPRTEKGGGPVKLLYGTQIGTAPPTFVLALSRPVGLHFSYLRFLEIASGRSSALRERRSSSGRGLVATRRWAHDYA